MVLERYSFNQGGIPALTMLTFAETSFWTLSNLIWKNCSINLKLVKQYKLRKNRKIMFLLVDPSFTLH